MFNTAKIVDSLAKYAKFLIADPHFTDDALQDARIRLFLVKEKLRGRSKNEVVSFCKYVVYSCCQNWNWKTKKHLKTDQLSKLNDYGNPLSQLENKEEVERLTKMLQSVKFNKELVMIAQGEPYEQTAKHFGINENTLRQRVCYARKNLKSLYNG